MNLDLSGWFKVSGATPNRGFQAIKRAVGEGAEEWTQTMSTYAIKSVYSNIDWNKALAEANESGLMGVAVGGIADQINAHLPKVLHKIDQEVDHKINPALQPITNALVKVELRKQITKTVQPDNQILTEAMRLNDEAVKFKLASDEHGRYVEADAKKADIDAMSKQGQIEFGKQALNNQLRNQQPEFEYSPGQYATTTGRDMKKITRTKGIPTDFHGDRTALLGNIGEIAQISESLPYGIQNTNQNYAPDGWDKRQTRAKYDGREFNVTQYYGKDGSQSKLHELYIKEKPALSDSGETPSSAISAGNSIDNIAQSDENVNLNSAYDPINNQIISYNQQDVSKLQQLHQQHGNDFTEHLNQTQEVIYNHLLDQAPRDQQGRYQDPITGETWIDEVVDYNGKKAVKTEYQAEDINNRQRIRDDILAKFGGQEISLNEINQEAGVTKKSAGKLAGKSYSKQPLDHVNAKVNSAMHIDELGLTMTNVQIENNSKNTQKNAPTYIKGDTIIIDNGRAYEASLVVKHYPDGKNTVYDVVIQKEIVAPHTPMRDNAPESPVPHLGSPSEQQWVNSDASSVNIAQSDENVNPEVKTKLSETANQVKSSLDELKARHFKLTGDNDIAFNAFAEAIQDIGNIEGYYDPKTNTVHIGELAEYVLNHEVVHKTLRKHMELRPEIMQATADRFGIDNIIAEYNQKGYGEQSVNGHALDPKQPKDVRLAVEEKVADEFNTYLDQYQKGRANYYANKVGLSPTIRAWFDRIIEGLKEFFGQADKIKQFYAQIETGKFATSDQISMLEKTVSRLEDSIAYKRSPDAAKRALTGFKMVQNGWRKRATLTQLTADSAERYRQTTGLAVSDNAKLVLTNNSINHIHNSGHLNGQGRYGKVDTNPLTEADIANIPLVFTEPDTIEVKSERGYKGRRISLTKQINKTHVLGIELAEHDGDFYVITYFNKSRSPQQVQASSSVEMDADFSEEVPTSSRPKRSPEAYADNILQTDEKVNPVEYNELHEAEYQPSGSVLDRRQRFDATATEVDGQVQASERAWRDNRGTEVGTNDEVAREKIAQLLKDYRNPDRELTHFFYVKDGVIVGHNVTTLNDPISSSVGAKEAMWGINNRMERLGADKFYLAHNHPSGNLSASSGDRHVTQIIQKQLGDKFGGHIITDHDGILTSKNGYFDKTNINLGEQYVKDGVQITTEDKALELAKEHFDPKVNHDKIGLFMLDVLYRPIGYERFRPRMKDGKVDIEATNNTIKQMAAKHNGIVTLVAAGDDFKHIDNRTGIQGIIGDQLMLPTDFGDFRSLNNFEGGDTKSQSARLRKYLARNGGKNNFLHDGASDIKQVSDFYYNDHQSAAQLRQSLIDQLWEANKKGQGVDHIWHEAENALDDTYMVRASNNSPFYSISIHTLT